MSLLDYDMMILRARKDKAPIAREAGDDDDDGYQISAAKVAEIVGAEPGALSLAKKANEAANRVLPELSIESSKRKSDAGERQDSWERSVLPRVSIEQCVAEKLVDHLKEFFGLYSENESRSKQYGCMFLSDSHTEPVKNMSNLPNATFNFGDEDEVYE